MWWEKYKKWRALQSDCETMNKELTDKKKNKLVHGVWIPRKQVQDCSKGFPENNKRYLGKPFGHDNHYMINIGGQRPKTGSNWLLNGPYLQRCLYYVMSTCQSQIPISSGSSSWTNKGI